MRRRSTVAVMAAALFAAAVLGLSACGAGEPASKSKPQVLLSGKHMFFWPDVSGRTIVWMDDRNGDRENPLSNPDVFGYDLGEHAEFPICTLPGRQLYPRVSGDTVVWSDYRNVAKSKVGTIQADPDVYRYDLATKREYPVCRAKGAQLYADVSGDIIVWSDRRNPQTAADIYGYDISEHREFPIAVAPGDQSRPAISGQRVVWADYGQASPKAISEGTADAVVYLRDLSTGQQARLSKPGRGGSPVQIDGGTVIWVDVNGPDPKNGFYLCDLATRNVRFVTAPATVLGPYSLSDGRVVWAQEEEGLPLGKDLDVVGYDAKSGRRFVVAKGTGASFVTLSGDTVAWQDFDAEAPDNDVSQLVMDRLPAGVHWQSDAPSQPSPQATGPYTGTWQAAAPGDATVVISEHGDGWVAIWTRAGKPMPALVLHAVPGLLYSGPKPYSGRKDEHDFAILLGPKETILDFKGPNGVDYRLHRVSESTAGPTPSP